MFSISLRQSVGLSEQTLLTGDEPGRQLHGHDRPHTVWGLSTRVIVLITRVAKLKPQTEVGFAITVIKLKEAFPDPPAQILTISWSLLRRNASSVILKLPDVLILLTLIRSHGGFQI